MFTGIVEAQATVRKIEKNRRGIRLTLKAPRRYSKLKKGSSLAIDGVCLTVTRPLTFDVIPETLKRTHFRHLKTGDRLNLERPLKWKGRVDGHLVQGHVDAVARVLQVSKTDVQLSFPKKFDRAIVEKGSVALNGVSLTVGRRRPGSFWVHVIPHTLRKTNLKSWKKGSRVNLETDVWLKAFDKRRSGR